MVTKEVRDQDVVQAQLGTGQEQHLVRATSQATSPARGSLENGPESP